MSHELRIFDDMNTYLLYPTKDQEETLESFLKENNIPFFKDDQDEFTIPATPEEQKRQGWEESFKEMHANGDDKLIIPDFFDDEQFTDWSTI